MLIPETYFTVQEQTRLFLYACLLGIPIGLLYDICRACRALFHHNMLIVALEDILFLFLCAVLFASFTNLFCRGEFRLFYPIGAFLGFLLYLFAIGNPILRIIRRMANGIRKLFAKCFSPCFRFFARFQKKFQISFWNNQQIAEKSKKKSLFHLIAPLNLLYNKRKRKQEVNQNGNGSKTKTTH